MRIASRVEGSDADPKTIVPPFTAASVGEAAGDSGAPEPDAAGALAVAGAALVADGDGLAEPEHAAKMTANDAISAAERNRNIRWLLLLFRDPTGAIRPGATSRRSGDPGMILPCWRAETSPRRARRRARSSMTASHPRRRQRVRGGLREDRRPPPDPYPDRPCRATATPRSRLRRRSRHRWFGLRPPPGPRC